MTTLWDDVMALMFAGCWHAHAHALSSAWLHTRIYITGFTYLCSIIIIIIFIVIVIIINRAIMKTIVSCGLLLPRLVLSASIFCDFACSSTSLTRMCNGTHTRIRKPARCSIL